MPNLRKLEIELSDTDLLENPSDFPRLEELTIVISGGRNRDATLTQRISQCPKLRELDISLRDYDGSIGLKIIISENTKLERAVLGGAYSVVISNCPAFKSLKTVDAGATPDFWNGLATLPALENLDLDVRSKVEPRDIGKLIQLDHLTNVTLDCRFSSSECLAEFGKIAALRSFKLHNCWIWNGDPDEEADIDSPVQPINLSESEETPEVSEMTESEGTPEVKVDCSPLGTCSNLDELVFHCKVQEPDDLRWLVNLKSLKVLDLSKAYFDHKYPGGMSVTIEDLPFLQEMKWLHDLKISASTGDTSKSKALIPSIRQSEE